MSEKIILRLKGHVRGAARAPLLVVNKRISFYGEVDKDKGLLLDGRSVANRILITKGTRGSTVAPYIIYGLKKKGLAPAAIVVSSIEPMIVAGCVMSSIPLASGFPEKYFEKVSDECMGELRVEPPEAFLLITCKS
ncbi:hypothetical protein PYJP_14510 [Pyrofollis japonicus]|uniref:aconitase X swivel domain-containing protein n=1 Tax=Pyrofollis japonicus TaxID=3060460 RepID=UPI00295BD506|nr:DUF126 domain-containing protein [Pyrofollis japonicus]BEP18099.1 hypothetical protein PYJP_14510 [Pyrofollis japonicus]